LFKVREFRVRYWHGLVHKLFLGVLSSLAALQFSTLGHYMEHFGESRENLDVAFLSTLGCRHGVLHVVRPEILSLVRVRGRREVLFGVVFSKHPRALAVDKVHRG
jgi:hypothetical protein